MKGFIKSLEAFIAAIMIFIVLIILFPPQTKLDAQVRTLSYNCIVYLDNKGSLRYNIEHNLDSSITSDLRSCLPVTLDFSFKYCSVSSCPPDSLPVNKTIVSTVYLIAGVSTPKPYVFNLWVWSK